jgi:ABC-type transport system involved in multi-copper enzyme maturation permease subunit
VSVRLAVPPLNPVLGRELRQRMRGRGAWMVLTLYTAVLALLLWLVYDATSRPSGFEFESEALRAASAGRSVFHWLLFFMLGLICFIVPGLTAASIAGERERQTLVPLQVTLLSARSIVVGKLLASLAFVVLLIVATLPLVGVSFLLGGVSAAEVAKGVGMVLVVAVALAALGVACSTVLRRTQTATVTAYGLTLALVVGTFIVYGAQRVADQRTSGTTEPVVLALNPFAATADVVRGRSTSTDLLSPFTPLQELLDEEVFVEEGWAEVEGPVPPAPRPPPGVAPAPPPQIATVPGPDGPIVRPVPPNVGRLGPQTEERAKIAGVPFWAFSVICFLVLTLSGFAVAVRRLVVPSRSAAA